MIYLRPFILAVARNVYRKGAEVASPALSFLSVPMIAVFQFPAHLLTRAGYLNLGILTNEVVAVLGVPLILIASLKFSVKRLLPFRSISPFAIIALLLLTLGADIVLDYITYASELFLPLPAEIREQLDKIMYAPSAQVFVLKLFVLCVVPAVCEEIFFRGFFQTSIAARWGSWWAIFITAIVFAAMHGNIYYFHLYILLGLLFGWAYYVTGTLWASIACHVFNNCWTFTNHVREFKLPIEDAPLYQNVLIVSGGLVLFIAAAYLIQKKWKR